VLIAFVRSNIDISLWISAYTCHSLIITRRSCCYKMPRNILRCPENPLSYCLAVLSAWKPLRLIPHILPRIRSSQLFMCLEKSFEMPFDFSKILCSLLLLKFLPAGIMVNSICLVVFIDIPCLCHFKPNDSMCAYARDYQDILLNYLSDSDVLPDMSWFLTIQFFIDCPPKHFNLSILDQSVCFWSFVWK
jgi:hypothetical protein